MDSNGEVYTSSKVPALTCVEGGLTKQLNSQGCVFFSLKVLQTSDGETFRLQFHVKYEADEIGSCEEYITTRPFCVYSNKAARTLHTPFFVTPYRKRRKNKTAPKEPRNTEGTELLPMSTKSTENEILDGLPLVVNST